MEDYYGALYRGLEDQYVVLSRFKRSPISHPIHASELASEIARQAELVQGDLFVSLGAFAHAPSAGRGSTNDVSALPAVFLDIDAGAEGKYVDLPQGPVTFDAIKATVLDWGLPKPTAIISTANGYHFEWWLAHPFLIKTEEERGRAKAFLKGFNAFAMAKGKALGWKMDNMGDLARVKRAVGSINWKDPDNPRPVELKEFSPERRYSIETLEGFKPVEPANAPALHKAYVDAGNGKLPNFDSIRAGCPWVQHCLANAATLPEPWWYQLLTVSARCENGEQISHEISSSYPGYSYDETARKIRHALDGPTGPVTYAYIRESLGFQGLDASPLTSRVPSPISLGFEPPAVAKLVSSFVLDNETGRYFNWERLEPMREDAFRRAFRHLGLKNAPDAFNASKLAVKADATDYKPGCPRLICHDGRTILNTYRPPALQPVPGDCSAILDHFAYLFPDDAERDHLLSYFAHLVQEPATKIAHAVLIVGSKQGTGKSLATSWLVPILGEWNIARLSNGLVKGKWTANYADKQLGLVEEMMGDERLSTYNDLKEWISEEQAPSEQKFMAVRTARTPRGWLFITNHQDAFLPEREDRRLFVIETEAEPREKAYYDKLVLDAQEQLPAFADWLLHKDLSGFNSKARPPMTEAKARLLDLAAHPVDGALLEAFKGRSGVFEGDFGTQEDVAATLEVIDPQLRMAKRKDVVKALRAIGAVKVDHQVRLHGHKRWVWVWLDQERWLRASEGDLAAAYRPTAILPAFAS